jgi:hypothetical protein
VLPGFGGTAEIQMVIIGGGLGLQGLVRPSIEHVLSGLLTGEHDRTAGRKPAARSPTPARTCTRRYPLQADSPFVVTPCTRSRTRAASTSEIQKELTVRGPGLDQRRRVGLGQEPAAADRWLQSRFSRIWSRSSRARLATWGSSGLTRLQRSIQQDWRGLWISGLSGRDR